MYVAVKGGETAIANAHRLLADRRRGDRSLPALTIDQIVAQLGLAVDRVMAEASLHDTALAALAIKQSRGDMIEAIFLLRAYRTTLPRFGTSKPIETGAMRVERRVSATYKDLPGGQLLGPGITFLYIVQGAGSGTFMGITAGQERHHEMVCATGHRSQVTDQLAPHSAPDGLDGQGIPGPLGAQPVIEQR